MNALSEKSGPSTDTTVGIETIKTHIVLEKTNTQYPEKEKVHEFSVTIIVGPFLLWTKLRWYALVKDLIIFPEIIRIINNNPQELNEQLGGNGLVGVVRLNGQLDHLI